MYKLTKLLKHLEESILNIVLPKHCIGCQKEGTFLCSDCSDLIKLNSFQICPVCQKSLTEYGEVCRYCKNLKPEIDSLTIATSYDNKTVSKAIKLFKYKFIDELSNPLSQIMIKAYKKNKLPIPDIIIPIPLHPLRLRWRGFNQAELLAKDTSNNLLPDLPIKIDLKTLTRDRFTSAQANLKKSEDRQKNIQGAFSINIDTNRIKNKRILIIDDISTTNSTLFECGRQLRKLKPKAIHAIVIARQGSN